MFSFLNIPTIMVRKSKLTHEELVRIFKTQENEGKKWESSFFDAFYAGDEKKALQIAKGSEMSNKSVQIYFMDFMVALFTEKDGQKSRSFEITKNILIGENPNEKSNYVKDIKIVDDIIIFKTKDKEMKFTKLTSVYSRIKEVFPNIENKERYGTCHHDSILFARLSDLKCMVATGYVAPLAKKSKLLHSWVEFDVDGDTYVADVTRNLLAKKENYYKLRGVSGPVYKIPKSTIEKDLDMVAYLFDKELWSGKLYLTNRPRAVWWYKSLMKKDEQNREM